MSDTAATRNVAAPRNGRALAVATGRDITDTRRLLQLCLAGIWLFDAVLQYQAFMFTKGFSQLLGTTAEGNPGAIAGPISWAARLVEHHAVAANAVFATVQLLLALAIAWRPSVKIGLGVSIVWSLGVWWLGEGLGGVLTGAASPLGGAPGAVIIYALLAVLLWPSDRAGSPSSFVAGRPLGVTAARLLWLAMWGSLAYFAVQATNRTPEGLHDMISGMASGEPGWLARIDRAAATLLAHRGGQAAIVLAVALCVIAIGVFLPVSAARASLVLAVVVAAVSWVIGQDFGAIFTGRGTDPGSAPMLALLVAAYWPAGMAGRHPQPHPRPHPHPHPQPHPRPQWPPQPQEHSQRHPQPPGPHPHAPAPAASLRKGLRWQARHGWQTRWPRRCSRQPPIAPAGWPCRISGGEIPSATLTSCMW